MLDVVEVGLPGIEVVLILAAVVTSVAIKRGLSLSGSLTISI